MSANESSVLTTKPKSPSQVPNTDSILDIDMDCPLTSDGNSSRSPSSSLSKIIDMSTYNSGRGNNRRQSFGGQNWTGPPQQEYNPSAPMMIQSYGGRGRSDSHMVGESHVPLSSIVPGDVQPSNNQLDTAFAYGIRREDGSITRLVPADERSSGHANPNMPIYQGPEGLIVLPAPRQVSPNRRYGPEIMVPSHVVMSLNTRYPEVDQTQLQIDSIVQQNNMSSPPRRREKIYCDKWIHEGVCAFTQMGCKYKHEMPTDRATQMSLGLNHGLPSWYRRAYAINLSSPPTNPVMSSVSPPSANRQLDGNWRRPNNEVASSSNGSGLNGSGAYSGGRGNGNAPRSFGAIGPPPAQPNFGQSSYDTLKEEEDTQDDEEDDDTVTWGGRRLQSHHQ